MLRRSSRLISVLGACVLSGGVGPVALAAAAPGAEPRSIPERVITTTGDQGDRAAIARRLVELGIAPGEADAGVAQLTPEDVSVLAKNPQMIQLGGEIDNDDLIVGIGVGIMALLLIIIIT